MDAEKGFATQSMTHEELVKHLNGEAAPPEDLAEEGTLSEIILQFWKEIQDKAPSTDHSPSDYSLS